jgi:hypothetical protein
VTHLLLIGALKKGSSSPLVFQVARDSGELRLYLNTRYFICWQFFQIFSYIHKKITVYAKQNPEVGSI